MNSTTLNLKVSPRRILRKSEAASYCGLVPKRFELTCPVQPVAFSSTDLGYDMRDLDHWIDSLKSDHSSLSDADIIAKL